MTDKPAKPMQSLPLAIQDDWPFTAEIARGIYDLLSDAAGGNKGLTPGACRALATAAEKLVEGVNLMDWYLEAKPEE